MTTSPENLLKVRRLFQEKTGLPAISLGIQHYNPEGGGYHEGDDLLSAGGRLTTDYSKRESPRDRVRSNEASAIDIGDFRVKLRDGIIITELDLHRWIERNWESKDALWMREYIYSRDKWKVLRLDRLRKRVSGNNSHRTHSHCSKFRDVKDDSPYRFFKRFWDEMEGGMAMAFLDDKDARYLAYREHCWANMEESVQTPQGETITHEGVKAIRELGETLEEVKEALAELRLSGSQAKE
jgi:hypothetical protein